MEQDIVNQKSVLKLQVLRYGTVISYTYKKLSTVVLIHPIFTYFQCVILEVPICYQIIESERNLRPWVRNWDLSLKIWGPKT